MRESNRPIPISAYLVEAQTLDGLSGSPVFVRRSLFTRISIPELDPNPLKAWLHGTLWLLGLWRGAWFGPPDALKPTPQPTPGLIQKVPTGMGVVVPAIQVIEVLEHAATLRKILCPCMCAALPGPLRSSGCLPGCQ